jgi:hypothetical protein
LDNKLISFGRDDAELLELAHLNAGGFSCESDEAGDNAVCGREVDYQLAVLGIAIIRTIWAQTLLC